MHAGCNIILRVRVSGYTHRLLSERINGLNINSLQMKVATIHFLHFLDVVLISLLPSGNFAQHEEKIGVTHGVFSIRTDLRYWWKYGWSHACIVLIPNKALAFFKTAKQLQSTVYQYIIVMKELLLGNFYGLSFIVWILMTS